MQIFFQELRNKGIRYKLGGARGCILEMKLKILLLP